MKKIFYIMLIAISAYSCKDEVLAPDISGMKADEYVLCIGDKLILAPNITNLKNIEYVWLLDGKEVARDVTDYTFTATQPGNYVVVLKAKNKKKTTEKKFKILVEKDISIKFEKKDFKTPICKVIDIKPVITGPERNDYEYEWAVGDSIISKQAALDFIALNPGNYTLTLKVLAGGHSATDSCKVKVDDAKYRPNNYTLFDFRSSPWNRWALVYYDYSDPDSSLYVFAPYDEYIKKSTEYMREYKYYKILNTWGSYLVVGFDHSIVNVPQKEDITVALNIKYIPFKDFCTTYVSQDKNKNGIPDDEWYEIKNEDYGKETVKDYARTYTLLEYSAEPAGNDSIRLKYKWQWEDNQEGEYKQKVTEEYDETFEKNIKCALAFPGYRLCEGKIIHYDGWEKSFTLKGKLFSRRYYEGGYSPLFHYLNINDAVNDKGEPANLRYIDFVKVQRTFEVYAGDKKKPNYETLEFRGVTDSHLYKKNH